MIDLINLLRRRRIIAAAAVVLIAMIAIIIHMTIHITPLDYFDGQYNYQMIYGLLIYKIIELIVLYYILMYRHIVALQNDGYHHERLPKIQKHTKLLYFLIPQGNTVFGLIAYKLSGDVKFFLIFSLIALIALFIIKPNRLKVTLKTIEIR